MKSILRKKKVYFCRMNGSLNQISRRVLIKNRFKLKIAWFNAENEELKQFPIYYLI